TVKSAADSQRASFPRPSFPRSAWERASGRSASRLAMHGTQSLPACVPTRSVGTRGASSSFLVAVLFLSLAGLPGLAQDKKSQEITLPVVIEGMVDRPKDVDVFRFAGKKGQKMTAEVLAHRFGSPLDAMLTLYNSAGNQVAFNDDLAAGTRDARLEILLPADG